MEFAGRDGGGKSFAQNFGLGADTLGIGVKAVSMAIGTGGGVADNDGFAPFADFIKLRLADDLRRPFGPGGKGFVVRHGSELGADWVALSMKEFSVRDALRGFYPEKNS